MAKPNVTAAEMLDAGQVMRWHAQPQMNRRLQTNADHSWGVAIIVMTMLDLPSRALIMHALLHDIGERKTCDLGSNVGRQHPELKSMLKEAEEGAIVDILGGPLPVIRDDEKDILKAADICEALITIMLYAVRPQEVDGWPETITKLQEIAARNTTVLDFCELHLNPLLEKHTSRKYSILPF